MDEREDRTRALELRADRREPVEQPLPGRSALRERERPRELGRRGDTGARDAVAKAQDPDPPAAEDVVDRGVVDRVRRGLRRGEHVHSIQPPHAVEVGEQALRRGEPRKGELLQRERAMEKPARPGGVDEEPRPAHGSPAVANRLEPRRSGLPRQRRDRRSIDVLRARRPRLLQEEEIEVGAIPVRVGDLVVGARRDEELIGALRIGAEGLAGRWA